MALTRVGHIGPEDVLLVHAAAGGLGSQLGQISATLGPRRTIGTVGRPDKIEAARSFGYGTVLPRDERLRNPAAAPRPQLVVDSIGGATRRASLEVLGPGGRLIVIGNASDSPELPVGTNELFMTSRTVAGFSLGALSAAHPDVAGRELRRAVQLVVDGRVHVDVNARVPLEEAVGAHRRLESGVTTGKTVLAVGGK